MSILAITRLPASCLSIHVTQTRCVAIVLGRGRVRALLDDLQAIVVVVIQLQRCEVLVPKQEKLGQGHDFCNPESGRQTIRAEVHESCGAYCRCLGSGQVANG